MSADFLQAKTGSRLKAASDTTTMSQDTGSLPPRDTPGDVNRHAECDGYLKNTPLRRAAKILAEADTAHSIKRDAIHQGVLCQHVAERIRKHAGGISKERSPSARRQTWRH